jgi:hypothetical protein
LDRFGLLSSVVVGTPWNLAGGVELIVVNEDLESAWLIL